MKLIDSKLTLSIAESCTGGLASKVITDVPGSSEIFMGSVVAYNQIIKNKFLDIPIEMLHEYGPVSRNVSELMAINVRKKFKTNIGVSISGISGPNSDAYKKKVGLLHLAISTDFGDSESRKFYESNMTRNEHRNFAVRQVLKMIKEKVFWNDLIFL